jgi:hypothetical protein
LTTVSLIVVILRGGPMPTDAAAGGGR